MNPPVFIPVYTFTQAPLCWVMSMLRRGRVLEIGSGSGIIALYGSSVEQVVCTDVVYEAALTTTVNAEMHGSGWRVWAIATDGASALREGVFDVVVINPPYLPLDPKDELDLAYAGGSDLRLFNHLIVEGLRASRSDGVVVFIVNDLLLEVIKRLWGRAGFRVRYFLVGRTPLDQLYLILLKR